jgi:hypothetical protein
MQALKALVIFMGVLIFAGMGLLVYGLLTRVGGEDIAEPERPRTFKQFGIVEANLPAGATVGQVSIEGGNAVVEVRRADGGVEIRLFDLSTGAANGTIRLLATP